MVFSLHNFAASILVLLANVLIIAMTGGFGKTITLFGRTITTAPDFQLVGIGLVLFISVLRSL